MSEDPPLGDLEPVDWMEPAAQGGWPAGMPDMVQGYGPGWSFNSLEPSGEDLDGRGLSSVVEVAPRDVPG